MWERQRPELPVIQRREKAVDRLPEEGTCQMALKDLISSMGEVGRGSRPGRKRSWCGNGGSGSPWPLAVLGNQSCSWSAE